MKDYLALVSEPSELRQQLSGNADRAAWGNSDKMRSIVTTIDQVADSDVTVLLRGESGVGKELVSRAIHGRSTRHHRPFVKINCAALPGELLESELFGHERGAFTGAATARMGKFEHAHAGTLMLDEISELEPALQAKLLHVLQDGEFTRLGSNKPIQVDVRIIAATNGDLEQMMMNGQFREDLYFRIKVIELVVPALRERRDEIATLSDFFVARYSRKYNRPVRPVSDQLRHLFMQYEWPGNIRELENIIKRIVILRDEQQVVLEIERHLQRTMAVPAPAPPAYAVAGSVRGRTVVPLSPRSYVPAPASASLATVAKAAAIKAQRAAIEHALCEVHWNRRKAAVSLGVSYKTLINKIKECGLNDA
jgi:two-component system response regulator AtoC